MLKGVEVDFPGMDAEYVTKALVNLMFDLLSCSLSDPEVAIILQIMPDVFIQLSSSEGRRG